MEKTPASLLQRLRVPGDTAAWDRLVELYSPLLVAWGRGIGLQEADVADLVQEVFTLLLRKLPQFVYDAGKGFRAWLRTVTVNKARDLLRRRAARAGINEAALETAQAPEQEPFWEAHYREHVVRRLLEVMQAEFEPTTWRACWLCVTEGRTAPDVAAELQISAGAVRVAKLRVLRRLRAEMAGLLD